MIFRQRVRVRPSSGPRVSDMLRHAGYGHGYSRHALPKASRGTRIHVATQLFDVSGTIVRDEIAGFVMSYALARHARGAVYVATEQRLTHPRGWNGQIDRRGYVADSGRPRVIDLKTGTREGWHRIQVAAYACLAEHETGESHGRECWYLHDDGTEADVVIFDNDDGDRAEWDRVVEHWYAGHLTKG